MPYFASAPVTPLNSRPSSPVSSAEDPGVHAIPEHLTNLPMPSSRHSRRPAKPSSSGYTADVLAQAVRMVSVTQQLRAVEAARAVDAKPTGLVVPEASSHHLLQHDAELPIYDTPSRLTVAVKHLDDRGLLSRCEILAARPASDEELLV